MTDALPAQTAFGMTELEEKLKGQNGKIVVQTVLERLDRLKDDLTSSQREGLSLNEYSQSEVIINAVAAARSIVIRFSPF